METCISIYVTFEGLGLCCFNPKRGGAEIAFLRLPDHNLKIKISASDGREKVFSNIADDSKIELVSRQTVFEGSRLNNKGDFERKSELSNHDDMFDLRWLVDFEGKELHDRQAQPREKGKKTAKQNASGVRGLTEMFLPNAYFFAEQILSTRYDLEEIDDATSRRRTKATGLFGGALGAKVDAAEASLRIDGRNVFQFDEDVDPELVTRFFVTITNVCEPCAKLDPPQSDFHKYYEVLDFKDGKKHDFDLAGVEKSFPRPAMCELALLSKTESLDVFFKNFSV